MNPVMNIKYEQNMHLCTIDVNLSHTGTVVSEGSTVLTLSLAAGSQPRQRRASNLERT